MCDADFIKVVAGSDESELAVPVNEVGLCVKNDRSITSHLNRTPHQRGCKAATAGSKCGCDPSDPNRVIAVPQDPKSRDHNPVLFNPQKTGISFEVATVQLVAVDSLLNDEYIDSERE